MPSGGRGETRPPGRQEVGIMVMTIHSRTRGGCWALVVCAGSRSVVARPGATLDAEAGAQAAAAAGAGAGAAPGDEDDDGGDNGDDQQRVSIVPRGSWTTVTRARSRQGPLVALGHTGHLIWHGVDAGAGVGIGIGIVSTRGWMPINQFGQAVSSEVRQGTGEGVAKGWGGTGDDGGGGQEGAGDRVVAWAGHGQGRRTMAG